MSCFRTSMQHTLRILADKSGNGNICRSCFCYTTIIFCFRKFSTKAFDINQVVRSNRENGSLDGVKKSITQKVRKSKALTNKPIVATGIETDRDVPDWFTTVLESPLYGDRKIDELKQSQFKDFVEELEIPYLPSVSTVIKKTESKSQSDVLERWKTAKIKELGGEKKFQEYKQGIIDNGLSLHKCVELRLKGEEVINVKEKSAGHWKSVQTVLGDVHNVKSLETDCVHPEMFYRGKFDCIAELRNTLCLIEWKTSSTHKPLLSATYDNPLQLVAYMGAVNRSGFLKQLDISNLTNAALVYAYSSGEPATVHMMSQKVCERYWKKWLDRLYLYWILQSQESEDK